MAQRKITTGGIADNSITSAHILDGTVHNADMNPAVQLGAQGMVHGFISDPSTGTLTWESSVTATVDANGIDLYDSVIVGTDDMSFAVDSNGHMIMTIS